MPACRSPVELANGHGKGVGVHNVLHQPVIIYSSIIMYWPVLYLLVVISVSCTAIPCL